MTQFLDALRDGPALASPLEVTVRLIVALALGGVVAGLYRVTRPEPEDSSFPTTLVLLAILIAMVTQVIGDNIARAFSLVGALSIVRFRTVVRDTEDTAYVIFAVVVGMAVGAGNPHVAMIGIPIMAVAAFVMDRARQGARAGAAHLLVVRLGLGHDADAVLTSTITAHATKSDLRSVATASRGTAVELTYDVRLARSSSAEALVKALNRLEGVQGVELQRRAVEQG